MFREILRALPDYDLWHGVEPVRRLTGKWAKECGYAEKKFAILSDDDKRLIAGYNLAIPRIYDAIRDELSGTRPADAGDIFGFGESTE